MDATAIAGALLTPEGRADPYPLYARAPEPGAVLDAGDGWHLVDRSLQAITDMIDSARTVEGLPDDAGLEG